MTTIWSLTTINFTDGARILPLEAIDRGDAYRIVFRWADLLDAADQGRVPAYYVDRPKQVFQIIPDDEGGSMLVCNAPIDVDCTFSDLFPEDEEF